jgi:hypothetical protein
MDRQERGTPPDPATPSRSWKTTIKSSGVNCPTIAETARRKMPDEKKGSRNLKEFATDLGKASVREQSSYK